MANDEMMALFENRSECMLPHPYDAQRSLYFTDLFWTEVFLSDNGVDVKDLAKEHLTDANGGDFRSPSSRPMVRHL